MSSDKKRGPDLSDLETAPIAKKPKKKPTLELEDLPKFIYDPESDQKSKQKEIDEHGGRIRTLPVMAGHWPTHIYLACRIPIKDSFKPSASNMGFESLSTASQILSRLSTSWTFFDYKDLHISLAKTFSLRHSEIQVFCKHLGEAITAAKTGGIFLSFDRWKILVNDNKSTSFLSLIASPPLGQVLALIEAVDSVMKRFDHPIYYDPPVVHASVAWTPSDVLASLKEDELTEGKAEPDIAIEGYIKAVYCKVGKVVYNWSLE